MTIREHIMRRVLIAASTLIGPWLAYAAVRIAVPSWPEAFATSPLRFVFPLVFASSIALLLYQFQKLICPQCKAELGGISMAVSACIGNPGGRCPRCHIGLDAPMP
jgi:hypothetical protein